MTTYNEDGTLAVDPLTKVGIMLAIRDLARREGAAEPLAALEWALARRILIPRPGVALEKGRDDLILTENGKRIVADYWFEKDRRRRAGGKRPTLT